MYPELEKIIIFKSKNIYLSTNEHIVSDKSKNYDYVNFSNQNWMCH